MRLRIWGLTLTFALALLYGAPGIAAASDHRWPAWYVIPRTGVAVLLDTEPASGVGASSVQQSNGLSVGVDVGRHLGIELAGEVFETDLKSGGRTIGEYGIFNLIPQLRLRFPIGQTRLTPHALAGLVSASPSSMIASGPGSDVAFAEPIRHWSVRSGAASITRSAGACRLAWRSAIWPRAGTR